MDLSAGAIEKKHLDRRDAALGLIDAVMKAAGDKFFLADVRGKAIAKVSEETGKSPKVIYNYLRRYLQAGRVKNSLLPRYDKCGVSRNLACGIYSQEKPAVKLGRPSSLSKKEGVNRGIRITPGVEKKMIKGLKKFYLTTDKNSLETAYLLTLDEFFSDGNKKVNGVEIPVLPPAVNLPTRKQFRYCFEKNLNDRAANKKARLGETQFNLLHRDLHGDSTSLSFGPRSVYMIDATIADVYLVSSFDRNKIIGRPVVYIIIDVFSRMIVGFSVSLEGPSWLGAMLALDNMVADKVAFCDEYKIPIEKWQWDCTLPPEAIFADRGEFEGYNADVLVDVLGITIHNTPPYRGDLKGIVERQFGIAKEKYVKFIPGAVKMRERGEKDHRLDATLTLWEFRAMMITNIVDYNLNHKLTWYRPDEFLVADNVALNPISLWNWGIQNHSGILPSLPRDVIRFALLPRKEVTVTRYGIRLQKDVYYMPPPTLKNRGRSEKIIVAYDPRSMDHVYLPSDTTGEAVACALTPASKLYLGRDLQEAEDLFALRLQQNELDADRQNQTGANCRAQNKHIIKNALKAKEIQSSDNEQSDASMVRDIRPNRKAERDRERNNDVFVLGGAPPPPKQLPPPEIFDKSDDNDRDYTPAPDYLDMIKNVTKGKKGE